jgi:hypothetical protein
MTKREKRKQEKAAKKARLGYCHGCGAPWTALTYEHVPPARVQALIPQKYLRFNPLDPIAHQSKAKPKSKTQLPPCTVAHGGMRVKSFGECCQQLTQKHYGHAFFNWSRILLEMCERLPEGEERVRAVVQVEPLAVLKQIASMALAASEFNDNSTLARLRDFIQTPDATDLPQGLDFYAYLNPVRPAYALPQCRLVRKTSVVRHVVNGEQAMILAEVSVPPSGYVVLYRTPEKLDATAQALMNINHFASAAPNETRSVALDIPVRTPFGPMPLRYMQDAEKERRRVEPSRVT